MQKYAFKAVEKVVRRVFARGAVNETVYMKIDWLTESEDFLQSLTSELNKNPWFAAPVTHFVQQHAQVTVADEAKVYDPSIARAN